MSADGVDRWCMTSDKYVKVVIKNIEEDLVKMNQRLPSKYHTPPSIRYQTENGMSS